MAEVPGQDYDVDVGLVLGAKGTDGTLVVELLTDFPERLAEGADLWLQPRLGRGRPARIVALRGGTTEGYLVIALEGVGDRETASRLRGATLKGRSADSPPLAPGVFYDYQLVGLRVFTTDGRDLGAVDEVLHSPANDVLVVGEHLIPAISDVVRQVDLAGGRIVIEPMPGLLEDEE